MFWQLHSQDGLKPEQVKVLNRLLDAGPEGFEGGLSAKKYQSLAKVSKATATRHITDMLDKNCIVKLEGGGRNTKYEINWV
jgi:Fic family protein